MIQSAFPTVYVSYTKESESEKLISELEKTFKQNKLKLIKDKSDLKYTELIRPYMEKIGKNNFVLVVISDKYLKSENCMNELLQLYKSKDFRQRVFPVILPDAKIYKTRERIQYIQFWQQETKAFFEELRKLDMDLLPDIGKEITLFKEIKENTGILTALLKDINALNLEDHRKENFESIIKSINNKIHLKSEISSKSITNTKTLTQSFKQNTSIKTIILQGIEFIFVEGGTYKMGYCKDRDGEEQDIQSALPLHKVTIDSFYLSKYPVTQEQWLTVMGKNPSYFKESIYNPVESISWEDCIAFIEKINSKSDNIFRLPYEAEWEFAARGGNYSQGYPYAGSHELNQVAWFSENSNNKTHPVGKKKPNELGIYDMSGNIWEWCQDWYDEAFYMHSTVNKPTGPESGKFRVLRGGSWYDLKILNRTAIRYNFLPNVKYFDFGLRLAAINP